MNSKIKSFTDLATWQEGHKLVLMTYQLIEGFPKQENFAIIPQIQRSAISITSNIAEGFSRKGSKEKVQFYYVSLGSLTELHNQLIISQGLNYITVNQFNETIEQLDKVQKLLNGLIKSAKTLNT
jgi:four helix bundle protein